MITEKGLEQMQKEIEAQGVSKENAWKYAQIIGDTPVFDGSGNILVIDYQTGKEIAKLRPLKFFGEG